MEQQQGERGYFEAQENPQGGIGDPLFPDWVWIGPRERETVVALQESGVWEDCSGEDMSVD